MDDLIVLINYIKSTQLCFMACADCLPSQGMNIYLYVYPVIHNLILEFSCILLPLSEV